MTPDIKLLFSKFFLLSTNYTLRYSLMEIEYVLNVFHAIIYAGGAKSSSVVD